MKIKIKIKYSYDFLFKIFVDTEVNRNLPAKLVLE